MRALLVTILAATCMAAPLLGQGHGPVYGLSTPTLGRGGWSLDVAAMGRLFEGGSTAMLRPMLSYGLTEDLQVSASIPVPVLRDPSAPNVRAFTRMPAQQDIEIMVGWRAQRRGTGVGDRQETTFWFAADLPTDSQRGGLDSAPAFFGSVVTGYASRTVYAWAGVAHRVALASDDGAARAGDQTMASLVFGYRPSRFQADYPSPDWRWFVEVVGERIGSDRRQGESVEDSGGTQIYVAPTLLGLYGSWGVSGGPAFPLHRSMRGNSPKDGIRFAVNFTFWY